MNGMAEKALPLMPPNCDGWFLTYFFKLKNIIYYSEQIAFMKSEIRILGIDDGPFERKGRKAVLVVGTVYKGGKMLDGVLSTKVKKDGNNSTKKLIEMINSSKYKPQLKAILLDGISLGGFNVIDIHNLHKKTSIPVIVVMREFPNKPKIFKALEKINQSRKMKLIEKAGEIFKINKIYIQTAGIAPEKAKEIIEIATTIADIPESLRIAHIIASGVVKGESYGKA